MTLTAEQRGDLAEELLPIAARLACLVHGDGGVEDVQQLLDGYDVQELTALAVVLAGLVDPTANAADTLEYLRWDEHGRTVPPPQFTGTIRRIAGYRPRVVKLHDPRRDAHRLYQRGMSAVDIAAQVGVTERTAYRWVKAWRREGKASA